MKARKTGNRPGKQERQRGLRHSNRVRDQDHVTEMLKLCLQKICELQAEMELEEGNTHDPEAEGYSACALETLRFLSAQGLAPDHPMVRALTEKLTSIMAQREFTDYLEKMKSTLTAEEFKKLLIWAYQGCDLRYQRNCDHKETSANN